LKERPDKIKDFQKELVAAIASTIEDGIKKLEIMNSIRVLDLVDYRMSESYCRSGLQFNGIDVMTEFPTQ
jgi:hypothetical protein